MDASDRGPPRPRIGLQGLMLLVFVVGLNLGLSAWLSNRRSREAITVTESSGQRETTFLILNLPDPYVRSHVPADPLQWSGASLGSGSAWIERKKAWLAGRGQRHDLINIEVTGGTESFEVKPIVIKDCGGELNAHFIGRLTEAYRSRRWAHRVVRAEAGMGN